MTITVVVLVAAAPLVASLGAAASAGSAASAASSGSAQPAVDVVFVFDRSASTNEDRYHMAQEVDRLQTRFDDAGIDARYGLVTYDGDSRVEQPLTADFDSFEAAMHFPEGGSMEKASKGVLTATGMDFRDDAETVVVVVTDEDDDSSNATRADALAALGDHHFVAVSPATPYESSCAVHSEPCDSRSDNELRTMAGEVGGDWIAQSKPAADIVDGIADVVESNVDTSSGSGGGDGGSSSPSAAFETVNRSANRTTAEVGERVRFSKTVENVGGADGTYDAYLSHDGTILANRTVTIPAGESRTISFVHRFDEPGEYEVLVTHEPVATVNVTEPNPTSVAVQPAADGSRVSASVRDAWANDTVTIPVNGANLTADDVATIESVVVSVGDLNVTPVHDVAFDLDVVGLDARPNGTAPMPDHVADVRYLSVDSSLDGLAGVQFELVPGSEETTLYRYDAATSTWVPVERTALDGNETVWRTNGSNASLFAIGVRQPAISVADVSLDRESIDVGAGTLATVTVSNDGTAPGTHNVTLRLDGSVVDSHEVTVPANATRTVLFTLAPDEAGTYTVDVAGGPSTTLQVEATPTPSPTATDSPTATASDSPTPAIETATPTTTRTPGFGPAVALVALLGAALLARRRA